MQDAECVSKILRSRISTEIGNRLVSMLKTGRFVSRTVRDLPQSTGLTVRPFKGIQDVCMPFCEGDGRSHQLLALPCTLQSRTQGRRLYADEDNSAKKALARCVGIRVPRPHAGWTAMRTAPASNGQLPYNSRETKKLRSPFPQYLQGDEKDARPRDGSVCSQVLAKHGMVSITANVHPPPLSTYVKAMVDGRVAGYISASLLGPLVDR